MDGTHELLLLLLPGSIEAAFAISPSLAVDGASGLMALRSLPVVDFGAGAPNQFSGFSDDGFELLNQPIATMKESNWTRFIREYYFLRRPMISMVVIEKMSQMEILRTVATGKSFCRVLKCSIVTTKVCE